MSKLRVPATTRFLLALVLVWLIGSEARAATYAHAEAAFDDLDANGKATFQVMMTAAGYWAGVPRATYSRRLYEDTQRFQADLGHTPTGVLTDQEVDALIERALGNLRAWGFVEMAHPMRGRPIWVPKGIGGKIAPSKFGIEFVGNGVTITYNYFPNTELEAAYRYMLDKLAGAGQSISYQVLRKEFFAISSEKSGIYEYLRYHRDGTGLLGFTMFWDNDEAPLFGSRIATLVSASLSSRMLGTPMIAVPSFGDAATGPRAARPSVGTESAPAPAPKTGSGVSSGSGFFVSREGHLVTNNHVVAGCSAIRVFVDQEQSVEAFVIARDSTNDLALLATGTKRVATVALRTSPRLGERVAAFGYPHADILASSGNFTLGNVTALAGVGDDSRYLQVSTPVQSGNSGGPLLDRFGNLVGVVTAKLDAIKIMQTSGDLPQNVNFALKASVLMNFLDVNRLRYREGSAAEALEPEDLADQAKAVSAFILCK